MKKSADSADKEQTKMRLRMSYKTRFEQQGALFRQHISELKCVTLKKLISHGTSRDRGCKDGRDGGQGGGIEAGRSRGTTPHSRSLTPAAVCTCLSGRRAAGRIPYYHDKGVMSYCSQLDLKCLVFISYRWITTLQQTADGTPTPDDENNTQYKRMVKASLVPLQRPAPLRPASPPVAWSQDVSRSGTANPLAARPHVRARRAHAFARKQLFEKRKQRREGI